MNAQENKLDGIYKASNCVDWEVDISISIICNVTVKMRKNINKKDLPVFPSTGQGQFPGHHLPNTKLYKKKS